MVLSHVGRNVVILARYGKTCLALMDIVDEETTTGGYHSSPDTRDIWDLL